MAKSKDPWARYADPARVARLAAWADRIRRPEDVAPGSWETGPDGRVRWCWDGGQWGWTEEMDRFHRFLYREGWMAPFDWGAWLQDEGMTWVRDPRRVAVVDGATLARLLTAIFRSERFSEGAVLEAWSSGLLPAIFSRAWFLAWEGRTAPDGTVASGGRGLRPMVPLNHRA